MKKILFILAFLPTLCFGQAYCPFCGSNSILDTAKTPGWVSIFGLKIKDTIILVNGYKDTIPFGNSSLITSKTISKYITAHSLQNALLGGQTSTANGMFLGKAKSLNPYAILELYVDTTDGGYILLYDSSHTNAVQFGYADWSMLNGSSGNGFELNNIGLTPWFGINVGGYVGKFQFPNTSNSPQWTMPDTGGQVITSGTMIRYQLVPTSVKTSTYSANPSDFVIANCAAGSFTVTLTNAPSNLAIEAIKVVSVSGTYSVTVNTAGSDVFNVAGGPTFINLTLKNQVTTFVYSSSTHIWTVTDGAPPGSVYGGLSGVITSSSAGVTSLGTFTSSNLATALTDETGSGPCVFGTSPTISTPSIGSPTLTGTPVAPTPSAGDNSTTIPTTAFIQAALAPFITQTVTASSYSVSCTPTTTVTATTSTVLFVVTAQAGALLFNAPTGTWANGQILIIRVKDNGTARALTYNSIYRAGTTVAFPVTTTISKTLYEELMYNATDNKFDLLGYSDGY